MKVLLVANMDWYLYNYRLALAKTLRAQGNEVVLVSAPDPGRYVARLQEEGFRWVHWQGVRRNMNPFKELGALLHFVRIFRQEKPDLVHLHTIKPVLYGSFAAKAAGVKAVLRSITGRGYVFSSTELKARLLRPWVRLLYYFAFHIPKRSAVIFENSVDREYFSSAGFLPKEKAFLIRGVGVDVQRFRPQAQQPPEPVTILMAGRMLWDKGVGVLVEAARILKKKVEVRVVLVGMPDESNPASIPEATLRSWVAEGVVEWEGWQEDMALHYAQSHILAFPTNYGEGVPTVLLEAGACGIPSVVSDAPGCCEVITAGVNGLVVPPNDAPALAQALYQLVCNPQLREKMGFAARQIVLEHFTEDKINFDTLAVYSLLD